MVIIINTTSEITHFKRIKMKHDLHSVTISEQLTRILPNFSPLAFLCHFTNVQRNSKQLKVSLFLNTNKSKACIHIFLKKLMISDLPEQQYGTFFISATQKVTFS